ncbi:MULTISPECIES: hypothetical protein [Pseudonocardia]|uniref:hypothetical protein n=1 Tax=Pseudonocardia TaxID=1847 RepID=UPI000F7A11E2|nr:MULTISPECIES: hypothetical protein [Pseudonocardia]
MAVVEPPAGPDGSNSQGVERTVVRRVTETAGRVVERVVDKHLFGVGARMSLSGINVAVNNGCAGRCSALIIKPSFAYMST